MTGHLTVNITVDSFLMDTSTSVKRTPRIGPLLSLLPSFDSLKDGHLSKTPSHRSQKVAVFHRERERELTLPGVISSASNTYGGQQILTFSKTLQQPKQKQENSGKIKMSKNASMTNLLLSRGNDLAWMLIFWLVSLAPFLAIIVHNVQLSLG